VRGEAATILRYEISTSWSGEDQAFVAEAPELPGCMADGATPAEALGNLQQVMKEWIEVAQELDRSIPEPRGRLLRV
jgi:predicted RNase H-like HicB family nuclease